MQAPTAAAVTSPRASSTPGEEANHPGPGLSAGRSCVVATGGPTVPASGVDVALVTVAASALRGPSARRGLTGHQRRRSPTNPSPTTAQAMIASKGYPV